MRNHMIHKDKVQKNMIHKIRTTLAFSHDKVLRLTHMERIPKENHTEVVSAGSLVNMQHFNNIQC